MRTSSTVGEGPPPSAVGLRTLDDLAAGLRALRVWSGLSFRDLHRAVVRVRRERGVAELPSYNTVYRCLQPGRTRVDIELVVDIAGALGAGDQAVEWRNACAMISGQTVEAAVVSVQDALPAAAEAFVGREAELGLLTGLDPAAPAVIAVDGMAGIGKTCLVTHAAQRLLAAHRYDVCLWVDLRGYDQQLPPADPAAVLDGFLRRLGVAGHEISHLDLDRRAARFRQALAGRTALVVLDNAASVDQVRPLLPGVPGTSTLVTSRRHLVELPADHRIELGVLTPGESVQLLLSGAKVAPGERTPLQIVELLGHLPLAVALLAGRIRSTPEWTLDDQLVRLVERRQSLAVDSGIELALAASYDRLDPARQRLLRMIAQHPGQDLDSYAVAAVAGIDLAAVEAGVGDLVDHHLVQRRPAGRIALHDLIRLFARDRARNDDPPRQRQDALTRLLDHYRYTGARAADLHSPHPGDYDHLLADPGLPGPALPDSEAAARWLEAERINLLSLALHAANHGLASYTGDLSWILLRFLDVGAYYDDAELLHGTAVAMLDGPAAANARWGLGIVHRWHGHLTLARQEYVAALEVAREHGDQAMIGRIRMALGTVSWELGRYTEAAEHNAAALVACVASGQRTRAGMTHNNLGGIFLQCGRIDEAAEHFRSARTIAREMSDVLGEARIEGHLGAAAAEAGRYAEALEHYDRALELVRAQGNRTLEGFDLNRRGDALRGLGRLDEALDLHHQALAIAAEVAYLGGLLVARNSLGETLLALGRPADAADEHRTALGLAESCGNRFEEARAHDGLARALAGVGSAEDARDHWRRALTVFSELGSPRAREVSARLAAADPEPAWRRRSPGA